MSNPEEAKPHVEPTPQVKSTPTAPPSADVENQASAAPTTGTGKGTGSGVSAITRRWKREDWLKRGCVALRGLGLLFSLLAFVIMASNKHGPGKNFDDFEEYRYVLAIAILSTLYTGGQSLRHIHEMSTGKKMLKPQTSGMLDFLGDQIMAYFLLSSASSAIPETNHMREESDNIFTDSSAAAISMALLAFLALALSALISGFKLATQSYI